MNRLHDDLPSRRLARWLDANKDPIAWALLSMLSAALTWAAWVALYA